MAYFSRVFRRVAVCVRVRHEATGNPAGRRRQERAKRESILQASHCQGGSALRCAPGETRDGEGDKRSVTEVTMAQTLDEILAALPREERDRIERRGRVLIHEEMSLQELRKAMSKTQATVARRLKVRQDSVSKIEMRSDLLLSTLRAYIKAVGGDLELVARFPDRRPIRVKDLSGLSPRRRREKRVVAR